MTEQEHGSVAIGDSSNPMTLFSENVDRWGAAEWFDRLAKAIREQDKAVCAMHQSTGDDKDAQEITFETHRNIASSSAMTLVRDFEAQVRAALSRPALSRVTVTYAYCCNGPVKYCDCTNPSHGTATMGANEAGDDYAVIDPATAPKVFSDMASEFDRLASECPEDDAEKRAFQLCADIARGRSREPAPAPNLMGLSGCEVNPQGNGSLCHSQHNADSKHDSQRSGVAHAAEISPPAAPANRRGRLLSAVEMVNAARHTINAVRAHLGFPPVQHGNRIAATAEIENVLTPATEGSALTPAPQGRLRRHT